MWALIVFGIFFIFHKGTESRTSAFIDKLDDLVKAQTDEPSNRNKAISNEPGEPFDPEKEYNDILNEAPIVIFSKSYWYAD